MATDLERQIRDFDEEENYTCRICLEEECPRAELIAPCACKGGSKWVHPGCLDQWRSVREDKAFSRCTECLQYYQLICLSNDNCREQCYRRTRFGFFICKDFIIALFIAQVMILVISCMIYGSDQQMSNHLLYKFHMQQHPYGFYYAMGLFVSFFVTGMIGTCIRAGSVEIVVGVVVDLTIVPSGTPI
jgi:hypothetical protein